MSKVLSIYNDRAFYEVVLPSVSNTEYSFLLDAETFHLPANEVVELECIRNQWYFKPVEEGKSLEYIGPQQPDNNRLPSYGRYNLTTLEGEILTILVSRRTTISVTGIRRIPRPKALSPIITAASPMTGQTPGWKTPLPTVPISTTCG